MNKLKIIAAVVLSLFSFLPASFSKEPAFILYSDGTWEKAGTSVLSAPNTATLKIQAGLTMRSGDTKPVNNTKIILTKVGIPQIFKTLKIPLTGVGNYTGEWLLTSASAQINAEEKNKLLIINEALAMEKVAEDATDFNGQAVFTALPIRRVYANILTDLGGKTVWSVPIDLKSGENKLILSNDNCLTDYD